MSFSISIWLHVGRLHIEYVEFPLLCSHHRLYINGTFKDLLQKINNMIKLEKVLQKIVIVMHTILCAVLQ